MKQSGYQYPLTMKSVLLTWLCATTNKISVVLLTQVRQYRLRDYD